MLIFSICFSAKFLAGQVRKMGVVHIDGFAKAETLSWDAYNESADLIPHVEAYKELRGHYPELVQVDKIYGTNKNRKWCKKRGIRMTVARKGSKPKRSEERRVGKEWRYRWAWED